MPNPEFLPCPFCGSTLLGKQEGERRTDGIAGEPAKIICADCDARIFAHSLDKAIAAWNARPAQATEGLRKDLLAYIDKTQETARDIIRRGVNAKIGTLSSQAVSITHMANDLRAALAPSKIAPSEPLSALNEEDWQPSNDPAILALAAVAKHFLDAEHHNLDRINVEGPKREGQFAPGIIMSVRVGTLRATLDAIDHAALASTPAPKMAPMVSVKALAWFELREPNCVPERKGPFKLTAIAGHLREFMDARPAAFITVITQGYEGPLLQDGPECLMMADGRSMARAKRHIESSKAAHAATPHLEPLSQAGGQEPVAWLVRYFDWQRDKVWSEWMMTRVFSQPTEHTEVQPLYTRPAETRSGQSIAAVEGRDER